jgi:hypothetical protein
VREAHDGLLIAETSHCDTRGETVAKLKVDKTTFAIVDACIEIHRGRGHGEIAAVKELVGIEAYLGKGPELRQAFKRMTEPLAGNLFAETVRGVIQAETFLYKERGYASSSDYSQYWNRMYINSCRYYSNLDRVKDSWDVYANGRERIGCLFLRSKTYFLYAEGPGEYTIVGSINDTFHEMNTWIKICNDKVQSAKGTILRVPDEVCKESTQFLTALAGVDINVADKKEISGLLGTAQGCVHLIDMTDDSVNTLKYYLSHPWDDAKND